jgi:hypothetical protein
VIYIRGFFRTKDSAVVGKYIGHKSVWYALQGKRQSRAIGLGVKQPELSNPAKPRTSRLAAAGL